MNWFHNLKIATKLLISFLTVLILTVFLGIFSVLQLAEVRASSQEISGVWMLGVALVADMNTDTSDFRLAQFQRIQATTPEQRAQAERDLEQELRSVHKAMAEYERTIISEEDRRLFTTFKEGWERYVRKDTQLRQL
ncbi:MAG TPA: MCP four helix bundle domain-containing protein, partial [Myxococcaceae bacterium]|nr:MCP four helix bundle domain-containing protein [Myxococcaceae bacterium]